MRISHARKSAQEATEDFHHHELTATLFLAGHGTSALTLLCRDKYAETTEDFMIAHPFNEEGRFPISEKARFLSGVAAYLAMQMEIARNGKPPGLVEIAELIER